MEEIHFKLYKRYQKEMEILPFKNSRTALQKKKSKIKGVLVKIIIITIITIIIIIIIIINENHPQRVAKS